MCVEIYFDNTGIIVRRQLDSLARPQAGERADFPYGKFRIALYMFPNAALK